MTDYYPETDTDLDEEWVEVEQKLLHDAAQCDADTKGKMSNWSKRVAEINQKWVNAGEEARFSAQLDEVFLLIYQRLDSVYKWCDEDLRQRAAIDLLPDIKRYDPDKMELEKYLCIQIKQRVRGQLQRSYQAKAVKQEALKKAGIRSEISIDQPVSDEDDTLQGAQMTKGCDTNAENQQLQKDTMQTVMQAMVLNFAALKDQKKRENTLRHHRIFYTEHITWAAQDAPLPERWGRDILEALNGPYFRYFVANAPEAQALTLPDIENAILKMEGQVIPGKAMDKPLTWDEEGLLPAKVQISFFARDGVKVPPSTVSIRRTEYRKSLQEICSKCLF